MPFKVQRFSTAFQGVSIQHDIFARKLTALRRFVLVFICLQACVKANAQETSPYGFPVPDSAAMFADHQIAVSDARSDYQLMINALEEAHPGLNTYFDRKEWEAQRDALGILLEDTVALGDSISEEAFYRLMVPLVTQIRCGHSSIDLSKAWYRHHKYFPLGLEFFGEQAYVMKNHSLDSTIVQATQILQINGVAMEAIIDSIFPYIMTDGYIDERKWNQLQYSFPIYYAEFFGTPDTFQVVGKLYTDGSEVEHTIPAVNQLWLKKRTRRVISKKDPALRFGLMDDKTALLKIRTFNTWLIRKKGKQNYKRYLKKSFRKIRRKKVENLIIDLRGNTGGDDFYIGMLYAWLAENPFTSFDRLQVNKTGPFKYFANSDVSSLMASELFTANATDTGVFLKDHISLTTYYPEKKVFTGELYVITDAGAISAASILAWMIKRDRRGTVIGTETGSCNDQMNGQMMPTITLPKSGIRVTIPLVKGHFDAATDERGRGVMPHEEVPRSLVDVIQGRDTQLEHLRFKIKSGL